MSMMCILGAGVLATVWATFCCECSICQKPDKWKIEDEALDGERGAGNLYKRGKGAAVWSKRFFVITNHKLIYYADKDRRNMKGEIVLAGAIARNSSTRANTRKKKYFTISHPKCGTREFYTKNDKRRNQWTEKLNDISAQLQGIAHYGKLLKQGGMSKNSWQERWCICNGRTLDYFEKASDNQSKGSIDLLNAKITAMKVKDKKYCFEVVAAAPGKKGNKKYVFSAERDHELQQWLESLKKAVGGVTFAVEGEEGGGSAGEGGNQNPMHEGSRSRDDGDAEGEIKTSESGDESGISMSGGTTSGSDRVSSLSVASSIASSLRSTSRATPEGLSGFLQKKSPNMMKGWQKRYAKLQAPGEIVYYSTETDAINAPEAPKGSLQIAEIVPGEKGVQFTPGQTEFIIRLVAPKTITFKAPSAEEAQQWIDCILAWVNYVAESD